jgi:hypothetical protein
MWLYERRGTVDTKAVENFTAEFDAMRADIREMIVHAQLLPTVLANVVTSYVYAPFQAYYALVNKTCGTKQRSPPNTSTMLLNAWDGAEESD